MLHLKFKIGNYNKKEVEYVHPVCGHKQKFEYTSPRLCQAAGCKETIPNVHLLIGLGEEKRDRRIEFFVEGKV